MMERIRRMHYLVQRVGRNLLPTRVALLGRKLLRVSPGAETTVPHEIVDYYQKTLDEIGHPPKGKRVLLFGFGGSFAVACRLLTAGVRHVCLYDKHATVDHQLNARLLPENATYLNRDGKRILPDSQYITHILSKPGQELVDFPEVDIVLSMTVLEHVDDMEGWMEKLTACIAPGGLHLHMIDLRDHFFDTPFEMLCYSESSWFRWLNPRRSHLNRFRYRDYERVFQKFFGKVNIKIVEQDREAFEKTWPRIRQEFLTGDVEKDSATCLEVWSEEPLWRHPRGENAPASPNPHDATPLEAPR